MNKFSELPLGSVLQSNLTRHGFVVPTPVQAQAIVPALEGRDVVATAQTGTGKTLAFLLPILEQLTSQGRPSGIQALILTPTRELAIQVHEAAGKLTAGLGIRAAVVVGGMSESTQLQAIRKGAQVLIATPGRLYDFLDRKLVDLSGAHSWCWTKPTACSTWVFCPPSHAILQTILADRQTLFFSATIESSVAHLVESRTCKTPCASPSAPPRKPVDKVDLHLYEVEQDRKLGLLHNAARGARRLVPGLRAHQARRRPAGEKAGALTA